MSTSTERSISDGLDVPGSKDAAELIAHHSVRVWRSLKYLGVPERDLADASQEVFLVLYRRIDEFRGESSFTTWLYGICLRVAANFRRRDTKHDTYEGGNVPDPSQDATQDTELDFERARRRLRDALERIPPEQREVFVLFEIEELNMRAIANTVGCPLFTAYSRLRLARKNLKRLLRDRGECP